MRLARVGDKGFSIVELLIAIFITGVVSLSIYALYNTFYRQANIQDMSVEAQQNGRFAINLMERELINAGYAAGTPDIITLADPDAVEFIYTDPSSASLSTTSGKRLKVKYALQTVAGVQYLVRTMDDLSDATDVPAPEKVVPYVQALALSYYKIDGSTAVTGTQTDRNDIKFITVKLTTRTKENIQGTSAPRTFVVETHVRLRNIGVGQTASDTTAPSSPTGLQSRDPGQCNRLKVKWTKNTEGDVAGYKVYYGVASGNYEGVINIPVTVLSSSANGYSCSEVSGSYECTIFPTKIPFAYSKSDGTSTTTYYAALKAYDNSLNHSNYSTEVSGNPTPSSAAFDTGSNDTTLNPVKPTAVAGLTSANGALDGQLALSWTAYNTTNNPDVVGFRVYRSESAFSSYPLDPATQPGVQWIAGEPGSGKPELTQNATSYTDSGLVGCKQYYYAIAPVKCDTTLIPDNGADPDSKKYVQTDYNATCGDGSTACSAGAGFAAVAGSDTAPADSSAPSAPSIAASAGWKRVALSLTQPPTAPPPDEPEVSYTCLYTNDSSTYPEILTDTATYPLVSGCYQVNTLLTPSAKLVPDSAGVFTVAELPRSQSTSFWHDSMTLESPASPALADIGTYSYRAVTFNLCQKGSSPSSAQATTVLCGEDPPSGEKPPAVTGASVSCCSSPATLSWTPVPSNTSMPSSPTNPYDLAGYRIFRSTSVDFSASTMISGTAPFWGASYNDASVADGATYYYRIVSTDCPYEKNNPTEATIKADMISGVLKSALVGPVRPGEIERDELVCPDINGGTCPDDHREVLTGVTVDYVSTNGSGTSTPSSSFKHNTVTMFFRNTSAGTMTIQTAGVSWINSAAFLREIRIGGGTASTTAIDASSTTTTTNSPYTSTVTSVTLTPAVVAAGALYVPITFTFRDSSGNPIDMRDDQVLMELRVRNDNPGTTGCFSYLTVSGAQIGVYVPVGPEVTSVQQNNPSSPTFSYSVPGSTGLNTVPVDGSYASIEATGGSNVKVSANIVSNTTDETSGGKVSITSPNVKLYWVEQAITACAGTITAGKCSTPPSSGFTAVTMTNVGGNIWEGTIPARDTTVSAKRVWYYIVAADADGNYDRSPEIGEGAYVYDQKPFDPCDYTPKAPLSVTDTYLTWVADGAHIAIKWPKITKYTNNADINKTADPIVYQVWRRSTIGGAFTKVYEVPDNAVLTWVLVTPVAPATSSYYQCDSASPSGYCYWWDYVNATANDLTYYIVAQNSCGADANTSSKTSDWRECEGAATAVISVNPASLTTGSEYTVTVNDCSMAGGGLGTRTVNNIASIGNINYSQTITEDASDWGLFTASIDTTKIMGESSTKVYVSPTDLANDTITVSCPSCAGPPANKTVTVSADSCDFTPSAPTGLTGVKTGSNVDLSWSANSEPDIATYKVYRKTDAGLFELIATVAVGTTTYQDKPSQINSHDYYYRVTAVDTCSKESAVSSTVGPY